MKSVIPFVYGLGAVITTSFATAQNDDWNPNDWPALNVTVEGEAGSYNPEGVCMAFPDLRGGPGGGDYTTGDTLTVHCWQNITNTLSLRTQRGCYLNPEDVRINSTNNVTNEMGFQDFATLCSTHQLEWYPIRTYCWGVGSPIQGNRSIGQFGSSRWYEEAGRVNGETCYFPESYLDSELINGTLQEPRAQFTLPGSDRECSNWPNIPETSPATP
ncbi:hypothetical protein G7Y89_g4338 [Cudoniella acicularis]|uniref:Uncharacterized protein n=1 Tax=Cudoniella acicularis TaxID=354080 RepID=A0A8H4RRT4_9HELO|nr:hypothetical protein G7Y89_g4338 [Cudoniella acicularis]